MEKFDLLVPAASGVEASVKRELFNLGFGETAAENGRIKVKGDWGDVADLNVSLRCGERVLIVLDTFSATDFDTLYANLVKFPWEDWLPKDARILLDGKSVKSRLVAVKSMLSVAKKAVVDRLKGFYNCFLDESGARYQIGVALFCDVVTLTLDTSGDGLHKRGYRSLAYTAPLKETLAASLLDMSVFNPDKTFADPFCGSGTLPIEAALRALNVAPGKNRDFDFAHWGVAPSDALALAKEKALSKENLSREIRIFGSDINENAISIAQYHAKRAGVADKVHFRVADAVDFVSRDKFGVMISNLPYGIRIGDADKLKSLYADFGRTFRKLSDWNCYVLTPDEGFERAFGLRADKHRKLFNANIACCYYSFLSKNKPPKIKATEAK